MFREPESCIVSWKTPGQRDNSNINNGRCVGWSCCATESKLFAPVPRCLYSVPHDAGWSVAKLLWRDDLTTDEIYVSSVSENKGEFSVDVDVCERRGDSNASPNAKAKLRRCQDPQ